MYRLRICSYSRLFLAWMMVCLWVFTGGCGDDGNPLNNDDPIQPQDYPVYFADGSRAGWYFEYHPLTNSIDSFQLSFTAASSNDIESSADGSDLFIRGENSVAVVDLDSHVVVTELPYTGGIVASPDNRYVAITGEDLWILNRDDFSVFFHDTLTVGSGSFSRDGQRFYCISASITPGLTYVITFNLANGFTTDTSLVTDYAISRFVPNPSERYLYLYLRTGQCDRAFAVYDTDVDSIVHFHEFTPGQGDLTVTLDGRYVFYSNPGRMIGFGECPIGPWGFHIYDAQSTQATLFSTVGIVTGEQSDGFLVGEFALTPDGRWLVAGAAEGGNVLLAVDLMEMETRHFIQFEWGRQFRSLTCQKSY